MKKALGGNKNENPWEILKDALLGWDVERLRFLASQGADLNVRDAEGRPLGHLAMAMAPAGGDERAAGMIRELLALGCDPNAKDRFGETALHAACHRGLPECAKALLEGGASRIARDRFGLTPAHSAAFGPGEGAARCLRELASEGSDALSLQDNYGFLPIHWCAKNGAAETMRELLALAGNADAFSDSGESLPLSLAALADPESETEPNSAAGRELLRAGASESLALEALSLSEADRISMRERFARWRASLESEEIESLARSPARQGKPRPL